MGLKPSPSRLPQHPGVLLVDRHALREQIGARLVIDRVGEWKHAGRPDALRGVVYRDRELRVLRLEERVQGG